VTGRILLIDNMNDCKTAAIHSNHSTILQMAQLMLSHRICATYNGTQPQRPYPIYIKVHHRIRYCSAATALLLRCYYYHEVVQFLHRF